MRVLYIDIDTLRPDHLGCYGYHRNTSPNIDALAAQGMRFDNVYASDVPCLPSRTALITGRFGIQTGVVNHGGRGATLDLAPEGRARELVSNLAMNSWAARFLLSGFRTASFSSFPMRHSATWWTMGFQEMVDASLGMGTETADKVLPEALGWLDRHGREEKWFCHVHLWDPHTPYNTPDDYGNPFASDPIPDWYTEEIRAAHWERPGPHSAQEPWGFKPDEWGTPPSRHPWNLSDMDAVKATFDGYDTGVRYADDHVGLLCDKLAALNVLDDALILVGADHGEAFGELGVYADHMAADEATAHIPTILRGPGVPVGEDAGLHYHLDVAETLVDLAGAKGLRVKRGPLVRQHDGESFADHLAAVNAGAGDPDADATKASSSGRDFLITSQGAWTCQRGVRFGDHLYLKTLHDGYHAWPDRMLFDIANDPHEQHDLVDNEPLLAAQAAALLDDWIDDQLARSVTPVDPLLLVLEEGGPYHCRRHLAEYLERLRETGREAWADQIATRHASDLEAASSRSSARGLFIRSRSR